MPPRHRGPGVSLRCVQLPAPDHLGNSVQYHAFCCKHISQAIYVFFEVRAAFCPDHLGNSVQYKASCCKHGSQAIYALFCSKQLDLKDLQTLSTPVRLVLACLSDLGRLQMC